MRCPVCSRYVNNCTCEAGDWDREVRRSFNASARWERLKREKADKPIIIPTDDQGGEGT